MTKLYVLVETISTIIPTNKKIVGIYTREAGLKEIELKSKLNLDRFFNLEGPYTIISNSKLQKNHPNSEPLIPPCPNPDFESFINKSPKPGILYIDV